MKIKVRHGVFETNSSSEHSVSIRIGKYFSTCLDCDRYELEIDLYVEDVLDSMPIKELEAAIERKKEKYSNELENIPTDILEYELKKRKNKK